jgi:hypothetical protein
MRKAIFASLLALAGLVTTDNTASAQVVYYSSGYTPYYYSGGYYYPYYGNTVYSTPGMTYSPSSAVVTPSGVVTSSYYTPSTTTYYMPGYTTYSTSTYTYPYVYNYGYSPYYGGYYTGGWGWRRWR